MVYFIGAERTVFSQVHFRSGTMFLLGNKGMMNVFFHSMVMFYLILSDGELNFFFFS